MTEKEIIEKAAQPLIDALETIIRYNQVQAVDQYGDERLAETWGCVRAARKGLEKHYQEMKNLFYE